MQSALIGLLLLASSTNVQSDTLPDAPTVEKAAKPKKICRLVEADTGTRLSGRKVCKTAADWSAEQERNRPDRDLKGVR